MFTTSGIFNPGFSATCSYVTAQVKTEIDLATLATGTQPEMACETAIYSGEGFSYVFPLPDYQANAVRGWFKNNPPPDRSDTYNNTQKTRGFPNVSANGANYVIAVLVWPCLRHVGSIITLIHDKLLSKGKSTVGSINPVLYADPQVLNDITEGVNPGCGTDSFNATTSWDLVTGLGTPNYPMMLSLFEGLQ